MDPKKTLSITNARKKIFDIAEDVQKPGIYYTFTEKGRPKAVLMSAEEFDSWQETLEVMQEFPNLAKDIEEAEKDLREGNCISLEELLKKEGFVLADNGKKKYEIQRRNTKKGAKRNK